MAARILVVDDEPMVRALIVRALTYGGYEAEGLTGPELVALIRQISPSCRSSTSMTASGGSGGALDGSTFRPSTSLSALAP